MTKKTVTKKSPSKKTASKKAATKKAATKKAATKKAASKKTVAKKALRKAPVTAKKAPAKTAPQPKRRKAPPERAPVKRPVAERPIRDQGPIGFGPIDENPAFPVEVSAPDILDFELTFESMSDLDDDEKRARAVETLEAIEDLGIGDVPPGRRAAYGDVIAGTDTAFRRDLLRKDSRNSSCALVVRAVWRLLGAQDEQLLDKFVISKNFQLACEFARKCGAYTAVEPGSAFDPRPGDVLVIQKGNRQHIFTLIEVDGDTFTSIDGGEPSKDAGVDDGTCNGIHRMVRTFHRSTFCFGVDDRPVTGWIDLTKLEFSAQRIGLVRKTGATEAA